MRLFEAIVEANHRALAGDQAAGLHPAEFADALPVAALTCIDARLNPLFPDALGLPKEQFIWLRNAGNIITGPTSSTMRSLALACAVKGAKEVAIIGHNDCQVCKSSVMKLTEAFRALGVERSRLPENLTEFFGLFASERQNVMKAAEFVRRSPLIGPKVPVHGLLVDVGTGKLEWVVNGYRELEMARAAAPAAKSLEDLAGQGLDALKSFAEFKIGEMKFPEGKIGDIANSGKEWLIGEIDKLELKLPKPGAPAPAPAPQAIPAATPAKPVPPVPPVAPKPGTPKLPLPPRIRPAPIKRRGE